MSGTERTRKPEPVVVSQPEQEEPIGHGALGGRGANSDQAALAERIRAARQPERELLLPDLGSPSRGVWQTAMTDAFDAGLKGFVRSIPKASDNPYGDLGGTAAPGATFGGDDTEFRTGGLDDFADASAKFAGDAATSLLKTGLEEIGGTSGLLDLAKEYPVPAAILIGAAGYGAVTYLEGEPKLKLKVRLKPISEHLSASVSHDLKTGETGFKLQFKYEW